MVNRVVPIPLFPLGLVNVFAVVGERTVLVDTGPPRSGRKILDGLAAAGVAPGDVSLVLLTHRHVDHIGGVAELMGRIEAPVAIHALDAEPVRTGRPLPQRPTGLFGRAFLMTPLPNERVAPIEPEIVFSGELDLGPFGVDGGRVVPTPGHTLGSVSVRLGGPGGEEVIAADALAGQRLRPRVPAYPPFHDDLGQAESSVLEILGWSPERIYVGHGGPLDPVSVARWVARMQARRHRNEDRNAA